MLNVLITVDTEFSPKTAKRREVKIAETVRRDVYGSTTAGDFGLSYQMDLLDAHGLKAVFFLESLSPCVVGLDHLREMVRQIQERGHEVQVHLHTEWLARMERPVLAGRKGRHLRYFSCDEQTALIAQGMQNLRNCGARNLCAFRAGNYGANLDTLEALRRNGIRYDTSHNTPYLKRVCDMPTPGLLLQPTELRGVVEFPITFFLDGIGRYRHAQICAVSSEELQQALLQAWKRRWYSFVIVSHSFELIRNRKQPESAARPDSIVIKRFENLCRFLAAHGDKFRTVRFSDIASDQIPAIADQEPLHASLASTTWRYAEQLWRRLL